MTPEKHDKIKQLFLDACDKPAAQQHAFIQQQTDDEEIRQEVLSLLSEFNRSVPLIPSKPTNPLDALFGDIP
ncbi:MAG: hypothetical protein FWD53_11095, partial [Phycisphaerales bacterium]|nr:hypothetical protein [Phycisphaerales bacterium]